MLCSLPCLAVRRWLVATSLGCSDEPAVRQLFTDSPDEAQLMLDRKKGAKCQGVELFEGEVQRRQIDARAQEIARRTIEALRATKAGGR